MIDCESCTYDGWKPGIMQQGIYINGKHTYRDFGLYIAERTVTPGKKREVKVEIPYMNGSYDFSAMNGEPVYENAELKYVFDIAELTAAEMETVKEKVLTWFYLTVDARIEDDYSPRHYYMGNASGTEWEEDFGQGHLTLVFSAYPYKTAREETTYRIKKKTETFFNGSSHMIGFSLEASEAMELKLNGEAYMLKKGAMDTTGIKLPPGEIPVAVGSESGYVDITFTEEVFC